MKQGNRPTTLQQRLEIWEQAQQGHSDTEIAATMQLSPVTVRKWRRRAQREGRNGLSSTIGRPRGGPLSTASAEVRQTLRELRSAFPGRGPETLRLDLAGALQLSEAETPSRSRVAAFLRAEGLTRRYERRTTLLQPAASPPEAPHQVWEMDAQGVRLVSGVGQVTVINIGDPYSHVRVGSLACCAKSKASTLDYQLALRRAFLRYGLPERLSLDHDSAFFDNTTGSPFPSQLHLWLLALGVQVCFIHEGRPTEHGFIERTHQVVEQQAFRGHEFASAESPQALLDQRLDFLNRRYPSRALDGQSPLEAHPDAIHSGRTYRPEYEADLLDLTRVHTYLAQHHWFRQVTAMGQFSLGAYRYGLGKEWGHQEIEVTFDPQTQEFVCCSADGQRTRRLKAKGLTKANLMGELDLAQFANYQYGFPWTAEVCRQNLLHEEAAGMTL